MSGRWRKRRRHGRDVDPTFLEIGPNDALTDLERILDDNDDVYIGLPSAAWLTYQELRRQKVMVSLDGHGADELMGAYRQDGSPAAFRIRNALGGVSSNSQWAKRGVDVLRALMIRRQGHYFLRGGLREIPAQFRLVGDDDRAAARLGIIEPSPLSNVSWHRAADDLAKLRSHLDGPRHRGADAVHGLAPGDLYDGVAGGEQIVRWLHQGDRATGNGQSDAGGHPHGTPQGGIQFADAGVVERTALRLDGRVARTAKFRRSPNWWMSQPAQDGRTLDGLEDLGLGVGRRIWPYLNMKWAMARLYMLRRALMNSIDSLLGWKSRHSGAVQIGRGTTLAWRRLKRISGNRLSVGEDSIIHADIRFEESGGEVRIGSRTFIGRSDLVCFRSIIVGDDVIMSWGITIVDHDFHSIDWANRRNDVLEWGKGRKNWEHVAHAPVLIADKAWIGFNVSILKGRYDR